MESFYFLRHGETDWNLENRFQGQNDIPLNETGRRQAVEASRVLASLDIGVIFSSHLARARETTALLAESFASTPRFVVIPELSECSSEITARKIYSGLGRSKYPDFSAVSENHENPEMFIRRIEHGLHQAFSNSCSASSLIVAHGGTYWAICQILNTPPKDIPNCLPVRFEKREDLWFQEAIWS